LDLVIFANVRVNENSIDSATADGGRLRETTTRLSDMVRRQGRRRARPRGARRDRGAGGTAPALAAEWFPGRTQPELETRPPLAGQVIRPVRDSRWPYFPERTGSPASRAAGPAAPGSRPSVQPGPRAAITPAVDVLDYTQATAAHHGRLLAHVRRSGSRRGAHDLIIAAHAAETGRMILSRDEVSITNVLPNEKRRLFQSAIVLVAA
jgi:hypothetical protein